MRVGSNPQIAKKIASSDYFHQVIVPVYIPNNEEYFKDSFNVFKISLGSLLKTCHAKTFITVVNNGSSTEVETYLDYLFQNKKIQELIHTTNIGKLNAVNKALVGQSFPIITISDADVLFLNGWQKAVYDIYEAFPKAGAVCTTPNSRALKQLTQNIYFDNFFSKSLTFSEVKNPQAMIDFLDSIGNPWVLRPIHLKKNLTVSHKNVRAVVGAGHYVCTYRREALPQNGFSTATKLMGKKMMERIDWHVINNNFWRLSTEENFTYHMGNVSENWMYDKLGLLTQESNDMMQPIFQKRKQSKVLAWFKINVFGAILFSRHIFWKNFLRFKGLKKEEAKFY